MAALSTRYLFVQTQVRFMGEDALVAFEFVEDAGGHNHDADFPESINVRPNSKVFNPASFCHRGDCTPAQQVGPIWSMPVGAIGSAPSPSVVRLASRCVCDMFTQHVSQARVCVVCFERCFVCGDDNVHFLCLCSLRRSAEVKDIEKNLE